MGSLTNFYKHRVSDGIQRIPSYVNHVVLGANVAEDMIVPSGAKYVTLIASALTYAAFTDSETGALPAVPVDNEENGNGVVLIPAGLPITYWIGQIDDLGDVSRISLVSGGASVVTGAFYS